MEHKRICNILNNTVYFDDSCCPGQKGGVDNINKIFWEHNLKGTDSKYENQKLIDHIQHQINELPRKNGDYNSQKRILQKNSLIL